MQRCAVRRGRNRRRGDLRKPFERLLLPLGVWVACFQKNSSNDRIDPHNYRCGVWVAFFQKSASNDRVRTGLRRDQNLPLHRRVLRAVGFPAGGAAVHVSGHDIAGIWVAFFSRCQRYCCGQGERGGRAVPPVLQLPGGSGRRGRVGRHLPPALHVSAPPIRRNPNAPT